MEISNTESQFVEVSTVNEIARKDVVVQAANEAIYVYKEVYFGIEQAVNGIVISVMC